jgi:hypothetical protein
MVAEHPFGLIDEAYVDMLRDKRHLSGERRVLVRVMGKNEPTPCSIYLFLSRIGVD